MGCAKRCLVDFVEDLWCAKRCLGLCGVCKAVFGFLWQFLLFCGFMLRLLLSNLFVADEISHGIPTFYLFLKIMDNFKN